MPPGRSNCAPLVAISTCNWNIVRPPFGDQLHQTSLFLRDVALPVHGTSATTASKPGLGMRPTCRPSCWVIITLWSDKRPRLLASMLTRPEIGSLATTTPLGAIRSAAWVAFEPGAAQRSSKRLSCCGSRTRIGSILAASCRVTRPVS